MSGKKIFTTLMASLFAVGATQASDGEKVRNDGTVHGYVIDATTRKPVAGVIIYAISLKNANDTKEVLTDASGYFKFPELPVGEVKFVFDKKGYKNQRKDLVAVKQGSVIKLNVAIEHKYKAETEDFEHPFYRMDEGF